MKIRTLALSALTGAGLLLGANDKQIFDATIKHIDLGGTYLYYQNLSSVTAQTKTLPGAVSDLVRVGGQSPQKAKLAADVTAIMIKVFNPEVVKAIAASSVTTAPDRYVMKQFLYCNTKMPSFLDFMAKANRATAWQSLPADTKFAMRGEIHLGTLFSRVMTELRNSKNPKLNQFPAQLNAQKAQGIDIGALLNSIEGEIEVLICGSSANDLQIKLVVPDKNGTISPIFKGFLPPQQGSNKAMLPLPMPNGKMPVLIYGQNALTLVTDEALLNPIAGKATLGSLPQFSAYAREVPAQICGYVIVNFDQNVIDTLKALAAETPEAQPMLKTIAPFSLIAVSSRQDDGVALTVASNFSVPDAMIVLPYKATVMTMLPALQKAQGKAQQVQCVSNLKQLGIGLAMYAIDHNDTLPATLDALKKDYVTDAKIYLCPQGKTPYIYIGGGAELKKIEKASQYPVLFDAPGCGHEKISVCFADGHVMSIEVPNYQKPAQVIGVLNKKFRYTPKVLNALLAKIAEVK